jgi:hypothetical protein
VQSSAPGAAEYQPTEQSRQLLELNSSVYVPDAQLVQKLSLSAPRAVEYLPLGQEIHFELT